MKKIIVPFEGTQYNGELLEFIRSLNTRSKVFLTGVFLPETDYAQVWPPAAHVGASMYLPMSQEKERVIACNGRQVEAFCETHSIRHRVREDNFDFALAALKKETRFADLLLLSSRHFYEQVCGRQPNAYMANILHGTACPVLLLPDEPRLPGTIVLAYDGSEASIRAIREFAGLFPELSHIPTTLVYLDEKEKGVIPDQDLIRELGHAHFRNFRMLRLNISTDEFYDSWVGMLINPWLLAGAYGRTGLSRLFSRSFVQRMIREHKVPLFLAHR